MSLSSAQDKVLRLPELLEPILAHLPHRELLLAQRVSHSWKDIITHSSIIQQKLFFQAVPNRPCRKDNLDVNANSLLANLFPSLFDLASTLDDSDIIHDADAEIDPFASLYNYQCAYNVLEPEWYEPEERRQMILRPEASWRKMFPTDPPPRIGKFLVIVSACGCYGPFYMDAVIGPRHRHLQKGGARMGFIWDVMIHVLDDNTKGDFMMTWWRMSQEKYGEERGDEKNDWFLELRPVTDHHWECYRADEAYELSGLRVVECDNDLIDYVYDGDIHRLEAVPLSVQARDKEKEQAQKDQEELDTGRKDGESKDESSEAQPDGG